MFGKNNKKLGDKGESEAVLYLRNNGYIILMQNFRYKRLGEIDIIARENNCICFIEVKSRSSLAYGMPCESVNKTKQERIRKLAEIYIDRYGLVDSDVRFDVVEVIFNKLKKSFSINIIKNAF